MSAEFFERIAENYRTPECNGQVVLKVCSLCGYAELVNTSKYGSGVLKIPMHPRECPKCIDIHNRAPEIFNWIAGLINYQVGELEKKGGGE